MRENEGCLICKTNTFVLFQAKVLFKYDVNFHKCPNCGFIQTDRPYWLDEAYTSAITPEDIGLIRRNLLYSIAAENILRTSFDCTGRFLDFAGGYGIFVRMMRDKGFDFYWDDKYCENLFSQYFTLDDVAEKSGFEAVTSFEVFEHIVDPIVEITKLFEYSDSIIFSTELIPNKEIKSEKDWWYFASEGGQHISFYTENAFKIISEIFSCNFYTNGRDLHILTKKKLNTNPLVRNKNTWDKIIDKIIRMLAGTKSNNVPEVSMTSKLYSDYQYIKELKTANLK